MANTGAAAESMKTQKWGPLTVQQGERDGMVDGR